MTQGGARDPKQKHMVRHEGGRKEEGKTDQVKEDVTEAPLPKGNSQSVEKSSLWEPGERTGASN